MDKSPENSSEDNQQGVFSTPDLTVDAEKIAQDTEAIDEANRSKIASIFANTETGQRAQQLNDAMGVRAEQTASITEDLMIQNEPKKKHGKIPLIVALLLIAIIGLGGLLLRGITSGNENKTVVVTRDSVFDAYYGFLNYLVYGVDGMTESLANGLPENYTLNNPYDVYAEAVIVGQNGSVDKDEYLLELCEKYAEFADSYLAAGGDAILSNDIYEYFCEYARIIKANAAELRRLYFAVGKENAQDIVNSRYSIFQYSDDLKNYINGQLAMANYELAVAEVAEDNGCVTNDTIQLECLNENVSKVSQDVIAAATTASLEVDDFILTLRAKAMDAIAEISRRLAAEDLNE